MVIYETATRTVREVTLRYAARGLSATVNDHVLADLGITMPASISTPRAVREHPVYGPVLDHLNDAFDALDCLGDDATADAAHLDNAEHHLMNAATALEAAR